jgi:hypothetical protein
MHSLARSDEPVRQHLITYPNAFRGWRSCGCEEVTDTLATLNRPVITVAADHFGQEWFIVFFNQSFDSVDFSCSSRC